MTGKGSEELERANTKVMISVVVLSSQAEADKAEGPARRGAESEIAGHMTVVQVEVVLAAINDHPLLSVDVERVTVGGNSQELAHVPPARVRPDIGFVV